VACSAERPRACREAAIAGTPLTFALFTDASCDGAPAATQVVNVVGG